MIEYTKRQRNKKVVGMMFELMEINMDWVIGEEEMRYIMDFINNGTDYHTTINLAKYSAELEIKLINDKNVESFMNLRRKVIRSEDEHVTEMSLRGLKSLQSVMEGSEPE